MEFELCPGFMYIL
uniref:Uncharacterized protein n=1 Tax=Rhizophora mucronata TaxID=61149 RepID=A0A2P2QXU6_RHIMU